jgi:hypothetical protein
MANAVSIPRANLGFEFMVCFPRFLHVRPALDAALLRHHPRKTGNVQAFLSPWLQPTVLRPWSLRPSHHPASIPSERGFRTLGLLGMEQNKARESPPDWRMACENPSLNRNSPALLSLTMPCVGEVVLDSDALIEGCSEGGGSIALRSLLDEMQPGAVLLLHLFY